MTGKDFSGPVPEIRVSTPRPNVEVNNSAADEDERPAPRPTQKRSGNKKKDEGVVIIGEVGGVEDQS
jgi:transcription factor TFIIIB component B''